MPISNARRNYVFGMLVTLYFPNFVDRQNRDAGRRPAHPRWAEPASFLANMIGRTLAADLAR